jgi:MFS family permease
MYFPPALTNLIVFLATLRFCDAAGRLGVLSTGQVATCLAMFSISYVCSCLLAGRILHTTNAKPLVLASIAGLILTAIPSYFNDSFWPIFWLFLAMGIAVAFFANSIQTFMRGQTTSHALAPTIANYTLSWSGGCALGTLAGAFLIGRTQSPLLASLAGPRGLSALTLLIGLAMFLLIATCRRREFITESHPVIPDEPHPLPIDRRWVLIGWCWMFIANFTQRPLTGFLPKFYAQDGYQPWVCASLLLVLLTMQALVGFAGRWMVNWLYRPTALIAIHAGLIATLALLWIFHTHIAALIPLLLILGSLYGFIYFAAIVYVSNDARSDRNVGINEAVVGLGQTLSLFACDWIMRLSAHREAYYPTIITAAIAVLAVALLRLRSPASKPGRVHLATA